MANQFRMFRDKAVDNTGFSRISDAEGGRLMNKDGSINVRKSGMPFWERYSLFHVMMRMNNLQFILTVFMFYAFINVLFALVYVVIGVENLQGVSLEADNLLSGFSQAFFFSSQTLTTVGYGHISPLGLAANITAAIESFVGIVSFAMVTGLVYGRFSFPRAYLKFSENMLVTPFRGGNALMVRIASYKNNFITDLEAQCNLAMHIEEDGRKVTKYFRLPLQIEKISSLALSWTIVHPIDEESPLKEMSFEDFKNTHVEILYQLKGFDDNFSNIVQQRASYTVDEIVYGAKFTPMFHRSADGSTTVLEIDRINDHERVDVIPV